MADRPVLQPIIKRSHSPSQQAISNEALRSPTFIEEPTSPNLANAATAAVATGGKHSPQTAKAIAQGSYFALQPPATTTPSPSTGGILLNRLDREGVASPPAAEAPVGDGGAFSAALLRVASPDGSASESGASEMGQPAPSTAPTSAAGSPVPAHSVGGVGTAQKPNLSTLFMGEPSTDAAPGKTPHSATTPVDPSQPGSVRRVSSPPSPHCHFAPLPRVDTERPLPRRESSTANRVKPFVPKVLPKGLERTDSILATGSTATTNAPQASSADASRDEGGLPSPQRLWHAGDSSIPSAAALSQRLSSSLTFVDAPSLSPNPSSTGATGTASPGSRPTSRRSSSSRRSRSPSPHYYNQNRDRYRNVSATSASTAATGAGPEARTQSPNLSRHASTDALSLHYIEQQRDYSHHHHHHRDGTTRSESGGRIISRTSSRAGSERDATEASASADRSRRSSTSRVRASTSTATVGAVPFVDRDKEADLHRLETKALAGNADAERCVSPALRAHEEQQRVLGVQQQQQQQRERSISRGGLSAAAGAAAHATGSDGGENKSQVLKRTNSHEEVVQIKPPSGDGGEPERGDGELEEVLEEPEEAEAEAEAAGTRLVGEDDDEDEDEDDVDDEEDDDGDDDEDDDEDEEEDDNEEDRSREEENDDDEEEEEEPAEDRKTSLGAGVEVVRWHRAERDSAPPTPAIAQHQTPTTLSAPSSPPPPPVAGLPPVSAPTSPVSPGVAASS